MKQELEAVRDETIARVRSVSQELIIHLQTITQAAQGMNELVEEAEKKCAAYTPDVSDAKSELLRLQDEALTKLQKEIESASRGSDRLQLMMKSIAEALEEEG